MLTRYEENLLNTRLTTTLAPLSPLLFPFALSPLGELGAPSPKDYRTAPSCRAGKLYLDDMASPISSEPSTPRLSLPRGAFPDVPGDDQSPRGSHSPDSAGTSPASLHGWNLPMPGLGFRSSEQTAREEDAQSVMALAAGRYRPKDWAPDPLPTSPPEGTLSG